jgi:hypothetical protein
MVTLYRKRCRALTFENMRQLVSLNDSHSLLRQIEKLETVRTGFNLCCFGGGEGGGSEGERERERTR